MEFIKVEYLNGVATLSIDRPKALNAINTQVFHELAQALDEIAVSDAGCLIIRGGGTKAFVAGADIAEMSNMTPAEALEFSRLATAVFKKVERFPLPTIAAVCGYALGGGCELAMTCDIRIVSDTVVFAQPEAGLGITPGFGGTQRLPLLVGVSRAKEILFTGRKVKADEALKIGLCSHIYPVDVLFYAAQQMAEKIASNPPNAMRATKKALNESFSSSLDAGLPAENLIFASCFGKDEQIEKMKAFLNKGK
ncbi:MAG: enoyl-CoA hydratase/isomerase family protein [Clostridia bacterium]|nr:enoyl-CoA hydratase/isomerase family protein [Clostridia bacterium]